MRTVTEMKELRHALQLIKVKIPNKVIGKTQRICEFYN